MSCSRHSSSSDEFSPEDEIISFTPFDAPDDAVSDDECQDVLQEIEQNLEEVRELEPMPGVEKRSTAYNLAQDMLQVGLRFAHGFSLSMATIGLAYENNVLSGSDSVSKSLAKIVMSKPYAQVLASVSVNEAIVVHGVLQHVLNNADILAYLRQVGGGKFWDGLGRQVQREVMSTLPAILAAVAYAISIQQVCDQADENAALLCHRLAAPISNLIVVGVPAYILYGVSKKLISLASPLAEKKPEQHADLHWIQYALNYALRTSDALMAGEAIRQLARQLHPAMMQHPFTPLLPVLLDQAFRLSHYFAYQAYPVKDIVPWGCRPDARKFEQVSLLDGDEMVLVPYPTHSRKKALIFYALSTLAIVGATIGVHYALLPVVAEQRDPEKMGLAKRVGYESGLLMANMLLTELVGQIPNVYRASKNTLKSYLPTFGLFASQAESDGDYLLQEQQMRV